MSSLEILLQYIAIIEFVNILKLLSNKRIFNFFVIWWTESLCSLPTIFSAY